MPDDAVQVLGDVGVQAAGQVPGLALQNQSAVKTSVSQMKLLRQKFSDMTQWTQQVVEP